MPKQYTHLNQEERELIAQYRCEGKSLSFIAKALGRNKSSISRELSRNASTEYSRYTPCRAHARATHRWVTVHRRPRLKNDLIRQYVIDNLEEGWSPEQIAGRLPIDHPDQIISHEAIYQYIYDLQTEIRLELIQHLRRAHKKRKNKGFGRKEKKTKIPNRNPIDARPKAVEDRKQYGHWEGDTLISRKSKAALHTLVERKSRLLVLSKLDRKSATETSRTIIRRLGKLPLKGRRTLTLDNGTENAKHEKVTAKLGMKCYFARPYASWQRGTNENMNGLVRWYLPKGTDFSKIDKEHLKLIEYLINSRPRKCLGYKTPLEVAASSVALAG
jgi:transposase, IS30 family